MNAMAARHPEAAVASVAPAIDDPEPAVSGAAMQVLSQINPPIHKEAIGATLRHSNPAWTSCGPRTACSCGNDSELYDYVVKFFFF